MDGEILPKDELQHLREEIARLKLLLKKHGMASEPGARSRIEEAIEVQEDTIKILGTAEKIALFRRLFKGRTDVFALRWESARGKSGYSPTCGNEWNPSFCQKPRTRCCDCEHRLLLPVTDQVIYDHLAGKHTVGIYPLLTDDTCHFLAVDFDAADWRDDARSFKHSCAELQVPAALEISRSGNGAHVWIFFDEAIPAHFARQLGVAIIDHTCNRTRQLSLTSYDRFFPNQDTLPKSGFGNLIALPLQKHCREMQRSVFVDNDFQPWPDQWAFLASLTSLSRQDVERAIQQICGDGPMIDVAFPLDDEDKVPWNRPANIEKRLPGPMPETMLLVTANRIFIEKYTIPTALLNRLIRLAAFQNPEFYKAQAMRLAVWNKPRVIGCAENHPRHISLPRGCLDALHELLKSNDIRPILRDERVEGRHASIEFLGILRDDQQTAVDAMLRYDVGVLCAPTAFGKTVAAAAIIAHREVSTLVLVHRADLMRQWLEGLGTFLRFSEQGLGMLGAGRNKLSGVVDIAVMQSLSRSEELGELLDHYGQIIVDECHHVSAFSFEAILNAAKARFVLGLTATPQRRDGHQPIVFMQCGPIRHTVARTASTLTRMIVILRQLPATSHTNDMGIQEVFQRLAGDESRNQVILDDVRAAYDEGRKILLLTERTEQLFLLHKKLDTETQNCFLLHGRLSAKKRTMVINNLKMLEDDAPCILLATGRLIGEGFDHPLLDTLFLAMPISWKGTLQQYAGRLHRQHAMKREICIHDYIDQGDSRLLRMWEKRRRGFLAMGYSFHSINV